MNKHQIHKFIVGKFVTDKSRGVSWGQQIKVAQDLFLQYPDVNFWDKLFPKEGVFSLTYYKTPLGLSHLDSHGSMVKNKTIEEKHNKSQSSNVKLEKEKIGEDLEVKNKKQNKFDLFG